MSDDRMFERNAQAWLEVGPTAAPKRVVDAALFAIQSTPQERDLRAPWRLPRLTTQTRFAAAAAVALLVVAAAILMLRIPQNQIGSPSPSPTVSPSPVPTASGVADLLRATWQSVSRGGSPLQLTIDDTRLAIDSSWTLTDADTRLRVQYAEDWSPSHWDYWVCAKAEQGNYSVSVSADGERLTLGLVSDPCAERAAALATDWARTGPLSTGEHVAAFFRPLSSGGSFSYTVPAGWSEVWESPTHFLMYAPPVARSSVQLMSNVTPWAVDADCNIPTGTVTTAAAAGHWLTTLSTLITTQPADVQIGGLSGVSIDVSVAPGQLEGPCSNSPPSNITTFGSSDGSSEDLDEGEMVRYLILDAGEGQLLLVTVGTDAPNFSAAIAMAMPVVETFQFTAEAH